MKARSYVTDTHSLLWYFSDNPRLSRKALKAFEQTIENGSIIIPIIVLAEIMYIAKKGRIEMTFAETVKRIVDMENFEIVPLDMDILNIAEKIEDELEMHDRLIAATALFFKVPLITRDQALKDSGLCDVIW
jgi:PIN domain nuclease of toxin-antitoxin system